ncbi:MAG: dihydrolipoyl dehydrogenase [Odoribacteraceae bacterium]|jgi:dihydrolipoamide dehydrogenase|nr:dihydrolipoyl dehydrogenase [Odoribacteraceae bacterium]
MDHDVIIIGSGPGGYVAAIRAARLGSRVIVVEREDVGGVCLNRGCIPTKSLLKSAQVLEYARRGREFGVNTGEVTADFPAIIARARDVAEKMSRGVQFLLDKNGVEVIKGHGRLTAGRQVEVTRSDGGRVLLDAPRVVLATGARARELPGVPLDGTRVIGYREALRLERLPSSMIVIGSGAIGSELAFFYRAMGTRVTLVEYMPAVLPLEDEEISRVVGRSFKKAGIEVMVNASVESVERAGDGVRALVRNKKGEVETREADVLLSAAGITPNVEGLGLEEAGVIVEKGRVKVDARYRTSVDGVYAIGDLVPGPSLAHVASAEAICCVEYMAGLDPGAVDYSSIPACTYTTPEVASVGLSEARAARAGYATRVGKFPLSASGKASAAGAPEGFAKLVFNADDDALLGAHLVGLNVTEMIGGLVIAKRLGARSRDIIKSVHPHPTISEAIMEAAADARDEAIHL